MGLHTHGSTAKGNKQGRAWAASFNAYATNFMFMGTSQDQASNYFSLIMPCLVLPKNNVALITFSIIPAGRIPMAETGRKG